jgi:hypothetical protein
MAGSLPLEGAGIRVDLMGFSLPKRAFLSPNHVVMTTRLAVHMASTMDGYAKYGRRVFSRSSLSTYTM